MPTNHQSLHFLLLIQQCLEMLLSIPPLTMALVKTLSTHLESVTIFCVGLLGLALQEARNIINEFRIKISETMDNKSQKNI